MIQSLLGAALLLLSAQPSQAITLSFNPIAQNVASGSPVDVELVISGLGASIAPSLSAFDVDVSFDPGILAFSSVTFGPFLGDPALGEAFTSFNGSVPGLVNLNELSLLEGDSVTCFFCIPPYLDDLQSASFTLATLTFNTLSAGTSSLGLSINALVDASVSANDLIPDVSAIGNSSLTVTASTNGTVPEPAIWSLYAIGMLGMGLLRTKWSNKQP